MARTNDESKKVRASILHFMSFAGGFLMILTIALSIFTYTSASGV